MPTASRTVTAKILRRRLYEHQNNLTDSFTRRYPIHKPVYFEYTQDMRSAIARGKLLKGWTRDKKNALISSANPQWLDLTQSLT